MIPYRFLYSCAESARRPECQTPAVRDAGRGQGEKGSRLLRGERSVECACLERSHDEDVSGSRTRLETVPTCDCEARGVAERVGERSVYALWFVCMVRAGRWEAPRRAGAECKCLLPRGVLWNTVRGQGRAWLCHVRMGVWAPISQR